MKVNTVLAISSLAVSCVAAGVKIGAAVKKHRSKTSNEIDYNRQMVEIQARHDAEMAALKDEELKNEKEHQDRMSCMQKLHDEKISKMEEIREELLTNIDLCKGASPEEISRLNKKNEELLKLLHEIAKV